MFAPDMLDDDVSCHLRAVDRASVRRMLVPVHSLDMLCRWTSIVELYSSPAAQSRHHLRTVHCSVDSWIDTFFGKHEHGALWLL